MLVQPQQRLLIKIVILEKSLKAKHVDKIAFY